MIATKQEFARLIGVSPSRISQYIKTGIIGPDALQGAGRSALVKVDIAKAQIAARRHAGQATGNGLFTRVAGGAGLDQGTAGGAPLPDDLATQIQRAKLEEIERRNRMAQIEEARNAGRLVTVEDFRAELGKAVSDIQAVFTGMAPDIANALAAKFGVPQRDLLMVVTQTMTERRRVAAAERRSAADAMPETVAREIEFDDGGRPDGEDLAG